MFTTSISQKSTLLTYKYQNTKTTTLLVHINNLKASQMAVSGPRNVFEGRMLNTSLNLKESKNFVHKKTLQWEGFTAATRRMYNK